MQVLMILPKEVCTAMCAGYFKPGCSVGRCSNVQFWCLQVRVSSTRSYGSTPQGSRTNTLTS
jgi:hypothetical protein